MTTKPIRLRQLARRDVESAIDQSVADAGPAVAVGFIDALEATYKAIVAHPAAGSPRYAHELGLPGLRSRLLKRYPYPVFYVERDDHIDVWRVLHAQRDIPSWMKQPED